jgi:hypothetical protein
VQSSAGRGVLRAAGRAAAARHVNGCEFAPSVPLSSHCISVEYHARASAPRDAAIQSMNSRATVGPYPSHAIPPAVSCPFAVYSRSAYHHTSTRSSCRRHRYYLGRVVTESPDWPLVSSHEKTRRVRRVHVVGTCTEAVGRSTCEEVRPPPPLPTCTARSLTVQFLQRCRRVSVVTAVERCDSTHLGSRHLS